MARICVSLTEEATEGIIDRMVDLAPRADLFEIRGDCIGDLDLLTIVRAKSRPLLFTCRPEAEGGRWKDTEARRRLILLEAVKRGFDYVDVEHRSRFMDVMLEKSGAGLVVSFHDFHETPADLGGLYQAMSDRGADVVKIAVTPRSFADVGRLLALARKRAGAGGPPLIAIALGPMGVVTRILAGRYGAPFTYAAPSAGAEAASGQIPVALMRDLYRVQSVTPATRVYGILGADVSRSLSPVLHNSAFQACGLDAVYVPLQAEALDPFLAALPDLDLSGFSVTRPFKEAVLPRLHEVDETAVRSGSVNTVLVSGGRLFGSSSDGTGVVLPLNQRRDVRGLRAVILGAGGAARAAAHALLGRGARVTILARDATRAAKVGVALGAAHGALETLAERPWDVLINATPVGSAAKDETPVAAQFHRKGSVVFDMVYHPLETRFLREAREAGCLTVDGLEMLIAQAAVQFQTWTGVEPPLARMKAAALGAIGRDSA